MQRKNKGKKGEGGGAGAPAGASKAPSTLQDLGIGWMSILGGVVLLAVCVGGGAFIGGIIGNSPIANSKVAIKAMYKAMEEKNFEDVEMYVKLGADVNVNDGPAGNTPLMEMVHLGDIDGVKLLLRLGADPSKPNFSEFSPLLVAAWCAESHSHQQVAEVFRRAKHTCAPIAKVLLDAGANPNTKMPSQHDITPLHWMVTHGAVQGVRDLLEAGADPNAPLDEGSTPYHFAVDMLAGKPEQNEIIDLLVKHGADTATPAPTPSDSKKQPAARAPSGT